MVGVDSWLSGYGSILAADHLQATLSTLPTYYVPGQLSPVAISETEIEYSSFELRNEGLVWLIGAVVCLLAANRGSNCSLMRAMEGRQSALQCSLSLADANQLPQWHFRQLQSFNYALAVTVK